MSSVYDKFGHSVHRTENSPNYKDAFEQAYREERVNLRNDLANAQDQLKVVKAALETAQATINVLSRQLDRRETEVTRLRKQINGSETKLIGSDEEASTELHGE